MNIPWAKPALSNADIETLTQHLSSDWLSMGPRTKQFEEGLADIVNVNQAIAVSSGTAALDIALKSLMIGPGDEVIIPAMTYIAVAFAVSYQGAKIVLADINPDTFTIDVADVRSKITKRTKCIISVDYGGQIAAYDLLEEVAKEHNIYIVEDGAHSLGATYRGRPACSFGNIATTSFHIIKSLTTVEGGMIFTNSNEIAKDCRIIRNQGEDPNQKYRHIFIGNNYRMTDIEATMGLLQLSRLTSVLERRSEIAARYAEKLADMSDIIHLPQVPSNGTHAWFFYSILIRRRNDVRQYLATHGIDARVIWPILIHKQPIYANVLDFNETFPTAERVSDTILSLPLYYDMTVEEQDYVIDKLRRAVKKFKP